MQQLPGKSKPLTVYKRWSWPPDYRSPSGLSNDIWKASQVWRFGRHIAHAFSDSHHWWYNKNRWLIQIFTHYLSFRRPNVSAAGCKNVHFCWKLNILTWESMGIGFGSQPLVAIIGTAAELSWWELRFISSSYWFHIAIMQTSQRASCHILTYAACITLYLTVIGL